MNKQKDLIKDINLTSKLERISSTLLGLTAPLTPLVTILTGGGGKRRDNFFEGSEGSNVGEEEPDSCLFNLTLLLFF